MRVNNSLGLGLLASLDHPLLVLTHHLLSVRHALRAEIGVIGCQEDHGVIPRAGDRLYVGVGVELDRAADAIQLQLIGLVGDRVHIERAVGALAVLRPPVGM